MDENNFYFNSLIDSGLINRLLIGFDIFLIKFVWVSGMFKFFV